MLQTDCSKRVVEVEYTNLSFSGSHLLKNLKVLEGCNFVKNDFFLPIKGGAHLLTLQTSV